MESRLQDGALLVKNPATTDLNPSSSSSNNHNSSNNNNINNINSNSNVSNYGNGHIGQPQKDNNTGGHKRKTRMGKGRHQDLPPSPLEVKKDAAATSATTASTAVPAAATTTTTAMSMATTTTTATMTASPMRTADAAATATATATATAVLDPAAAGNATLASAPPTMPTLQSLASQQQQQESPKRRQHTVTAAQQESQQRQQAYERLPSTNSLPPGAVDSSPRIRSVRWKRSLATSESRPDLDDPAKADNQTMLLGCPLPEPQACPPSNHESEHTGSVASNHINLPIWSSGGSRSKLLCRPDAPQSLTTTDNIRNPNKGAQDDGNEDRHSNSSPSQSHKPCSQTLPNTSGPTATTSANISVPFVSCRTHSALLAAPPNEATLTTAAGGASETGTGAVNESYTSLSAKRRSRAASTRLLQYRTGSRDPHKSRGAGSTRGRRGRGRDVNSDDDDHHDFEDNSSSSEELFSTGKAQRSRARLVLRGGGRFAASGSSLDLGRQHNQRPSWLLHHSEGTERNEKMTQALKQLAAEVDVLPPKDLEPDEVSKQRWLVLTLTNLGNLPLLRRFMAASIDLRSGGAAALFEAVYQGHPDIFGILLNEGVGEETIFEPKRTTELATAAAVGGQYKVLHFLQDHGVNLESCSSQLWIAASEGGSAETLRWLSDQELSFKAGFTTTSAVVAAARGGHVEALKQLYELGVNPGEAPMEALCAAATSGSVETLEWLVGKGVDIGKLDYLAGGAIIEAAAARGHISVLEWLHGRGLTFRRAGGGYRALAAAAAAGSVVVLNWLKDKGCEPKSSSPFLVVESAARGGSLEALEWLADQGIRVVQIGGSRSLTAAAGAGHLQVMKWLVNKGLDLGQEKSQSAASNAVVLAARNGHLDVLNWLAEKGVKPTNAGQAAIAAAAAGGRMEVLKWLSDHGVAPNATNVDAWQRAASGGHLDVLNFLKQTGQIPLACNKDLCLAASRHGHPAVLEWLLTNGCDPLAGGGRAVVTAAEGGHIEVLKWLSQHGATAPGDYGKDAIQKAAESDRGLNTVQAVAALFLVPLDTFPTVADAAFSTLPKVEAWPAHSNVTRTLLINLLTVSSPAAERVLEAVAQEVSVPGLSRAIMPSYMRANALYMNNPSEDHLRTTLYQTIAPADRPPPPMHKSSGLAGSSAAMAIAKQDDQSSSPGLVGHTPHGDTGASPSTSTGAGHAHPAAVRGRSSSRFGFSQKIVGLWRRWSRRTGDVPILLGRVAVPGVTSPEVLRALAAAPREEVFSTLAARAIVLGAWSEVRLQYYANLFLEAAFLAALCSLTGELDTRALWPEHVEEHAPAFEEGHLPGCVWVLLPIWTWNVLEEAFIAHAFLWQRATWQQDYLTSMNGLAWVRNAATGALLALTFTNAEAYLVCPLCALVGFSRWWKLLYALRGLDYFGERLLPILGAFQEVLPFTLVLLFYTGAFVHGTYALSFQGLDKVVLAVYRLGVLGDFDLESDVYGATYQSSVDLDTGEIGTKLGPRLDWWVLQLLLFLAASFLLTIAMMNIFIEVMGSAFDRQEEMAEARFLRARAAICLSYTLRPYQRLFGNKQVDQQYVWMCYLDKPNEERECRSVRQSMARACVRLGRYLDSKIRDVAYQQDDLDAKLAQLSVQQERWMATTTQRLDQVESMLGTVVTKLSSVADALNVQDPGPGATLLAPPSARAME